MKIITQEDVDIRCEETLIGENKRSIRKLIQGRGINDLPHLVGFKDENDKLRMYSYYSKWSRVFTRAYSPYSLKKNPTYSDVTVGAEWIKCSNFVGWCKSQQRESNWVLDKDLLVLGNRVYGPHTCIFIPQWLNTFTLRNQSRRGDFLIGANWCDVKKFFQVVLNDPMTGKPKHIGICKTEQEAHSMWMKTKLELAESLRPNIDAIDTRLYPNIVEIISKSK